MGRRVKLKASIPVDWVFVKDAVVCWLTGRELRFQVLMDGDHIADMHKRVQSGETGEFHYEV